ncbi:hypothetical protein GH733_013127, partial [Mirounga leonina]
MTEALSAWGSPPSGTSSTQVRTSTSSSCQFTTSWPQAPLWPLCLWDQSASLTSRPGLSRSVMNLSGSWRSVRQTSWQGFTNPWLLQLGMMVAHTGSSVRTAPLVTTI